MNPDSTAARRRVRELVLANHILAFENVLDAYGHVSVRNPDAPGTFLLSRSRSPEIVNEDDILVHDFAGNVDGIAERELYRERFIHGSIYDARPDVQAVIHSHADDVLPFSISNMPFKAVFHGASSMGAQAVPVWDIRTDFGNTNMLVSNVEQGDSLTQRLDGGTLVLMRGHGFAATGRTLIGVMRMAAALPRNARVLLDAIHLGGDITPLNDEECAIREDFDMSSPALQRHWEYWCRKIGEPYEAGGF
jgi:ribulose-5-phosphate 4-epimerase/fuculose-1-phosphate aldolase